MNTNSITAANIAAPETPETFIQVIPLTKLPKQRMQAFTYRVPADMVARIRHGSLVEVSFGRRTMKGMVIDVVPGTQVTRTSAATGKSISYKDIVQIYEQASLITDEQFRLAQWISAYYYSPLSSTVNMFAPRWFVSNKAKARSDKKSAMTTAAATTMALAPAEGNADDAAIATANITFSAHQQRVWDELQHSLKKQIHEAFLLHGVTGSGKTEIYSRVIQESINQGKQSLFLLPEIALTTQFISHFEERYSRKHLAILHSKMTVKEKGLEIGRIASGEARIILGPRSSLFAPFKSLGCVIVDEEHDASYKQYDQSPRYHVREVARELARIWRVPLILGSATPSLEAFHRAVSGEYQLLELPDRFTRDGSKKQLPLVTLVDMREEIKKGNKTVLSDELREQLELTLQNKEQALLFLNRRGMSTVVLCRDCGYVLNCPHCDIPFVFHVGSTVTNGLFCHHCNTQRDVPTSCPRCRGPHFKYLGTGTERIEMELAQAFPHARILRMDADTTRTRGSHERIITNFRNHKADILIGTQMITKGFDLPNVNLVGIISVDNLLNMPDFRASEVVFQLVTQVAGRAGRRAAQGRCIVQTYAPANPIFKFATAHDYRSFYDKEIRDREALFYPPFARLIKLVFAHPDHDKAFARAISLKRQIDQILGLPGGEFTGEVLGPSPSFIPKKNNRYYWHIIIKHQNEPEIAKLLTELPDDWIIDIDPFTLL